MAKKFEDQPHDGVCGHCKSPVPLSAAVCAQCGARWGTSLGYSKQQIYDTARFKAKWCGIICAAILIFFVATALIQSPWVALAAVLAVVPGIPVLGTGIGNLINMRKAAKAHITWWRATQ